MTHVRRQALEGISYAGAVGVLLQLAIAAAEARREQHVLLPGRSVRAMGATAGAQAPAPDAGEGGQQLDDRRHEVVVVSLGSSNSKN